MNIFRSAFRIVKHRLYVLTGRGIRVSDWVIEEQQDAECMYDPDLEEELRKAIEDQMRVPDHML